MREGHESLWIKLLSILAVFPSSAECNCNRSNFFGGVNTCMVTAKFSCRQQQTQSWDVHKQIEVCLYHGWSGTVSPQRERSTYHSAQNVMWQHHCLTCENLVNITICQQAVSVYEKAAQSQLRVCSQIWAGVTFQGHCWTDTATDWDPAFKKVTAGPLCPDFPAEISLSIAKFQVSISSFRVSSFNCFNSFQVSIVLPLRQ